MEIELSLKQIKKAWHGSLKAYLIGFFLSLLLTSVSFMLVMNKMIPHPVIIYAIAGLALLQAIIQLICFLHLGQEGKPHWETAIFFFMILILLIIVLGSIWVMGDLNYRTMEHHSEHVAHD